MPTGQQVREVLNMLRDSDATAMTCFPYFNSLQDRYAMADLDDVSSVDEFIADLRARNDIKEQ